MVFQRPAKGLHVFKTSHRRPKNISKFLKQGIESLKSVYKFSNQAIEGLQRVYRFSKLVIEELQKVFDCLLLKTYSIKKNSMMCG